ncbi:MULTISPECIES: 3'(2'),5'-bisphosphate nucleotidase CysQ [unclassified Campylobacter]|uniref:3'(2'),5'-bisphosphate nucleotidase CysQ family protein n=1 Tax=unclassified Campylobacter TaxID=2593542 RepID=UPI001237B291|nr:MULTISPECIES: inositol monophosphatase family protein [unclassified Campylobacter]KAA6225133.1 3'(2'),5'-bisphosphate nucleotidase CysQ [Campylobacter sp. LR196d]KAA6226147.1 3'(2'),5'-bisphosphate nucleotidase CysQ [Campylobacter sp. LR185c]KAA6228095.1 3'(2'),5'-bisphosphate nucleotidase CysQ [Campylobacter sp. LR286c]KAA6231347.1 3'(2'),5'-bisphosphate nucleotidase CysQ [Campylobacter sp. LR264d]KAA6231559.1 3'(2'),5'-bisphosphate nucleotidase CysQ [Campylobacter sp. LR291e]
MNLDTCLNLALDAANQASKAILNERKQLKVFKKDDGSPLSSADLVSNEIICEILAKSDIKICSEERVLSFDERKNLEYFWLIDPLDGTNGFLKNSNEFCVMISLIHKNRPILGLIKSPITNDIFYAHKDSKLYKNDEILNTNNFEKGKFKALLSVHYPSKEDENFIQTNKLETIKCGSGLKFGLLLQGEAGVYKRFESLHIWDLAAGDFLIHKNGGFMCNFNARLLDYNSEKFTTSPFIAVAKKEFLEEFL